VSLGRSLSPSGVTRRRSSNSAASCLWFVRRVAIVRPRRADCAQAPRARLVTFAAGLGRRRSRAESAFVREKLAPRSTPQAVSSPRRAGSHGHAWSACPRLPGTRFAPRIPGAGVLRRQISDGLPHDHQGLASRRDLDPMKKMRLPDFSQDRTHPCEHPFRILRRPPRSAVERGALDGATPASVRSSTQPLLCRANAASSRRMRSYAQPGSCTPRPSAPPENRGASPPNRGVVSRFGGVRERPLTSRVVPIRGVPFPDPPRHRSPEILANPRRAWPEGFPLRGRAALAGCATRAPEPGPSAPSSKGDQGIGPGRLPPTNAPRTRSRGYSSEPATGCARGLSAAGPASGAFTPTPPVSEGGRWLRPRRVRALTPAERSSAVTPFIGFCNRSDSRAPAANRMDPNPAREVALACRSGVLLLVRADLAGSLGPGESAAAFAAPHPPPGHAWRDDPETDRSEHPVSREGGASAGVADEPRACALTFEPAPHLLGVARRSSRSRARAAPLWPQLGRAHA